MGLTIEMSALHSYLDFVHVIVLSYNVWPQRTTRHTNDMTDRLTERSREVKYVAYKNQPVINARNIVRSTFNSQQAEISHR